MKEQTWSQKGGWKQWHGNIGEWNEPCVPRRNEEGTGYCKTHSGDANGGRRRYVHFDGMVGWALPQEGWRCPFADERRDVYSDGYEKCCEER